MVIEIQSDAGDLCIMRLQGRFLTGRDADYMREKAGEIKSQGRRHIIADLAEVPYLDSTSLGFLVSVYTSAMRVGGKLCLTNVSGLSREVLEVTRLDRILTIYKSVDEAKSALRA
jgi:anti-sigma B factor antagonist